MNAIKQNILTITVLSIVIMIISTNFAPYANANYQTEILSINNASMLKGTINDVPNLTIIETTSTSQIVQVGDTLITFNVNPEHSKAIMYITNIKTNETELINYTTSNINDNFETQISIDGKTNNITTDYDIYQPANNINITSNIAGQTQLVSTQSSQSTYQYYYYDGIRYIAKCDYAIPKVIPYDHPAYDQLTYQIPVTDNWTYQGPTLFVEKFSSGYSNVLRYLFLPVLAAAIIAACAAAAAGEAGSLGLATPVVIAAVMGFITVFGVLPAIDENSCIWFWTNNVLGTFTVTVPIIGGNTYMLTPFPTYYRLGGNTWWNIPGYVEPYLQSYTVHLTPGWNMISSPLTITPGVPLMVSSLNYNNIETFAKYDRVAYRYIPFIEGLSPSCDDFSFSSDDGYFVFCTGPASLTLYGLNPQPNDPINADFTGTGWYLVGYNSLSTSDAKTILSNIPGGYAIARYNKTIGGFDPYIAGRSPDSDSFPVIPEQGYFILYTGSAGSSTPAAGSMQQDSSSGFNAPGFVYGWVTINGAPTDGITVTGNGVSNVTHGDGFYAIDVGDNVTCNVVANYRGHTTAAIASTNNVGATRLDLDMELYNASAVSTTIPNTMSIDRQYNVSITMNNTGAVSWSTDDLVQLVGIGGTQGDASKFGATTFNLPSGVIVNPGQSYTWNYMMTAPDQVGTYNPQYRMWWNGTWFGDIVTKNVTVTSLSDYSHVKSHTIAGSSDGALSDYQVKFVVHSGSGTDSGQDVYLNGQSLSWPNDIRFADSNNNLYSYWIESYDANSATIWVKVSSIPTSGTIINMYYGKSGDIGLSNGANTFLVFDDFQGSSLDTSKWSASGSGSYSVSNGFLRLSSTSGDEKAHILNSLPVSNYVIEVQGKVISPYNGNKYRPGMLFRQGASPNDNAVGFDTWAYDDDAWVTFDFPQWTYKHETAPAGISPNDAYGGNFRLRVTVNGGSYTCQEVLRNKVISSTTSLTGNYFSLIAEKVTDDYDWVFARKYTTHEPTHDVWQG